MKDKPRAYAHYWRNSLADSVLGGGALRRQWAVDNLLRRPLQELRDGRVAADVVSQLLDEEPEQVEQITVLVRPQIHWARVEHATRRRHNGPDVVTPLVLTATLDRQGWLGGVTAAIVPRDILEPLGRGSFAVGRVADLDEFLARDPVPTPSELTQATDGKSFWQHYLAHGRRLLDYVCADWQAEAADYQLAEDFYLVKANSYDKASQHVLGLYDHLQRKNPDVALFECYADESKQTPQPCLPDHARFAQRQGHAGDEFPLARAQRDALAHVLAMQDGEILAVNGPPGTGKTTLLLSVVASLWVQAALKEDGEPPVIVAASANNQAVTNIIDAFGKDFAEGSGHFAGRWLPDVSSYGAYFASKSRERDSADKYQTRAFFDQIESLDYVERAQQAYKQAAAQAWPDKQEVDVATVVASLRELIRAGVAVLIASETVQQELGDNPADALRQRRQQEAEAQSRHQAMTDLADAWERYLADESILYALFAWLPPVASKRMRRARLFLREHFPAQKELCRQSGIQRIAETIRSQYNRAASALALKRQARQSAEAMLAEEQHKLSSWRQALGLPVPAIPHDRDVFADTVIRFPLFLLATHYWEGRWLLDMQALLPRLNKEKSKTGRKALKPRWRRRMKLTPCIVSTFFMLPNEVRVQRFVDGDFVRDYLYNFIDLLIVDEAGQATPEIAAASFALARKALVIGDTQQIAPIWSVPPQVDIGNLLKAGLVDASDQGRSYAHVAELGKTAASGSVMRIAQTRSRYHYDRELARGMFLYDHRRCFDNIIDYCNELCYNNKLNPLRGAPPAAQPLPALGYLQVDGRCQRSQGGSRHNQLEADTIAAWLVQHKADLEKHYAKPLAQIVGIVTPFGAQVRTIRAACRAQDIDVGNEHGMTVGTVHSLQGSERSIVLFSSVYSKHADGSFIDSSPSMLNVAASRAKDSFLVFGDIDLFEAMPASTPRGLLAHYLHRDANSELVFDRQQRSDLVNRQAVIRQLRDAAEHDRFLLDVLATARQEVHIITPWIKLQRIKEIAALDAMQAAVTRGIGVYVYTDPQLNAVTPGQPAQAAGALQATTAALRAAGIVLCYVRRMHSKLILVDDNIYCVGSFNWFSASRQGRYARHETSLVYQGSAVAGEIATVKQSLQARQTSDGSAARKTA